MPLTYRFPPCLTLVLFIILTLTLPGAAPAAAQDKAAAAATEGMPHGLEWPRTFTAPAGQVVVVYQPQLESFTQNRLTGRAAVSVIPAGAKDPVFGVTWLGAKVHTDRAARVVDLKKVEVTDVKFPHATADQIKRFTEFLEEELAKLDLTLSLDQLLTSLELVEKETAASDDLETAPPKIVFKDHPALLITVDGEPRMKPVKDSEVMRVVNSPSSLLYDPKAKRYYLTNGDVWMFASNYKGPWSRMKEPPPSAAGVVSHRGSSTDSWIGTVPEIIVATEPTELISSDGEPNYTPIKNTKLLFMDNTDSDVFMDIDSQKYFVLLAGRWYWANSMYGPWAYMPAERLPGDFAKISPKSAKGHVLLSVPGTDEARDAIQEIYIPQTAEIDRNKAKLEVIYYGEPVFKPVEGTEMKYAVNTRFAVFLVKGRYYCCDRAVWFESDAPKGPWIVCDNVPDEIYTLPPSCPFYYVKYVYVYDSTEDTVFIGYTQGYEGIYDYNDTVVYGTGYYYDPYWEEYEDDYDEDYYDDYYEDYYDDYYDYWGYGYGGGYYNRGRWWYYNRWHDRWGYDREIEGQRTVETPRGTWESSFHAKWEDGKLTVDRETEFTPNENFYDNREEIRNNYKDRRSELQAKREQLRKKRQETKGDRAAGKPTPRQRASNDVYADSKGNIWRRSNEGWQQRENGKWSASKPYDRSISTRKPATERRPTTERKPATTYKPPASTRRSTTSNLDRHYQSRSRGEARTRQYHSRPSRSPSRPPVRARGGGRRR